MPADPTALILAYFVAPLWLLAGVADWACHRAMSIETTTGAKEAAIHLVMIAEIGVPLSLVLFCDVNALVIAVMIAGFAFREATFLWDLSYATKRRAVPAIEQYVHSFLELLPLAAILLLLPQHWG